MTFKKNSYLILIGQGTSLITISPYFIKSIQIDPVIAIFVDPVDEYFFLLHHQIKKNIFIYTKNNMSDNTILNRNYIEMCANQIGMKATRMDVKTMLSGSITLDDFNLKGTMNTRLQSSIFNQFDEDLLNSKNSKCQADTYGAVYGPTYGDNLGTINCRGAFIGTETTGFIGSTYSAKNDVVSQNELQMNSLVRNQTVSAELSEEQVITNSKNNAAIPMNMIYFEPNLAYFEVVSYNTTGNAGYEKTFDSYFGNLWTLTTNGKSENNPTLGNSLNMDVEAITQINISKTNGLFNVQGNLKLKNYPVSYDFTQIDLEPVIFDGDSTFSFTTNGNVLVNGIARPFSNALLENGEQSALTNQTANLAGNFQFNSNIIYPGNATPKIININGNISNIGSGNFIEWPRVSGPFPNIGNANIEFPKSISSVARFDNINANIVYFGSNIMNNSNAYYNALNPPQYGTFIENIYNNMAIYNDQNASFIANNFIYVNPSNANNRLGNVPNYQVQFPVSSGAFVVGNIISYSTPINPAINSFVFPPSINSGTINLYNTMDTWVKYVKWTDPNDQFYSPSAYSFSNYVITNQFTLNGSDDTTKNNNYFGYSQGNIKNKAWRILDDLVNPPQYTINGTLLWAFQSGAFSSTTTNTFDPDLNPGLNNGEATFMLFSGINTGDYPMTASAHTFSVNAIASVNGSESSYDLLSFAYVDYSNSLITNSYNGNINNFKKDVLGTLRPDISNSSFYTFDTTPKPFTVQYLSPQEMSSETSVMTTLNYFSYNLPLIVNGNNRMIVLFYMKDTLSTNLNDVAMITNISLSASNYSPNNYLQPNLFYGWNLKSSATINTNVNGAQLLNPSSLVYLATGTDSLSLYDKNTTYLLMGPIKAIDFNKQYFYRQHLYCEALFGSSGTTFSGEFRVYRVESPTIISQNELVSDVLLTNPTSTNSFIININNNNTNQWFTVDTSTNNNLFVHNTLANTNYVYYVIRFWNYSNTSCTLRNLQIIQQPLPNTQIYSYDIINNLTLKKLTADIYDGYFDPFTLQYTYNLTASQIISGDGKTIQIYGKIQNRPNLDLSAYINIENGIVQQTSQISIYGNEIISNLNVSGVFASIGNDNSNFNSLGTIIINSNVNYWDANFYKYAWHANLLNLAVETLPPITPTLIENSPFSGLNGKLILQCGTANNYNETKKEYIEQPLYDNQISIMTWYFAPEKSTSNPLLSRDFTIRFKYQLYSEIRGDFFYFQYSPDLGRNYYNLIRQSGDIKSVKSVALFTTSLWKQAEFYLPGGNTTEYIFRWVYSKDLSVSNGFDIVYLADLGVNYTGPVLVDNNGYTTNYSNEFVGNITTGGSVGSSTQSYNLPFPKGTTANNGFVIGNINYGGQTNMSGYIWSGRNNSTMYPLINTYYRQDQNPNDGVYPQKTDILFYKMLNNNGVNGQFTDKVWRLYDINTLKTTLGSPINYPGQTSWLEVNASTGFYDGTDMALMSSTQNNQDTGEDNGLTNGEATYLTLGPFNSTINNAAFADLTTKEHNLQFKYLPNTENGYDLTGVITYDYSSGNDNTVRDTLVKLLTFNASYHITQSNLDLWFNTNNDITVENIRYYPGKEGIYNSQTPVNGWINFSATIPPVPNGSKRIYVIFFAKDWLSAGSFNDVVLLHDIRFTFSTPSKVILDNNGYLYGNTSGSFKIVSVNQGSIVINIPGAGNKTITLSN
jgi:hypothetical protein